MYNLEKTIENIKKSINNTMSDLFQKGEILQNFSGDFNVETPADKSHGDLSTNIALVSARELKMPPRKIADLILKNLSLEGIGIQKTEIAGPGFINFFLGSEFFSETLREVMKFGSSYGESNYGESHKVMVEFVSANPTGPMHMGNARLGALGDCLASILNKTGYDVYKEFYINDAGNQIEKFGLSLDVRYRQICCGEDSVAIPEECYQGYDIVELAKEFYDINGKSYLNKDYEVRKEALVEFALPKNIARMKRDMEKYKIIYDNWFHESKLHSNGDVQKAIEILKERGYTYEKDGSLWYTSTKFGAEKDDVLVRNNGIPTYFAADIAYHYNKFVTRGFDTCIDIWGADHHGHVERMKGVMEAMGIDRDRLKIILVQLVRLMKDGEVVRMSKRTGKSVQLSDLIDEVGADAARFIFNTHEASSGMDFDLDLAVKQDMQNPLYYVQYAYARICSIFRQTKDDISEEVDLNILKDESEKNLIYFIALYPSELLNASLNYDPTKITRYVISLATLFHKFYSKCKVISGDAELTHARLYLCRCVKVIIKSILEMFKVDAPEVME